MKSRTTLILAIVAAVIGGLVWWDYKKGTTTEETAATRSRLLSVKAGDVTRVELVRTNLTIVLEKTGNDWNFKQPLTVRADMPAVSSMIDELEFTDRTRLLTGVDNAEFGLTTPRLIITAVDKKGTNTVRIGRETPTKDAVYVQVGGSKDVAVCPKSFYERFDRSIADLRDRNVIGSVADSATRLEIKIGDRTIELSRTTVATNAEPRWSIVRPLTVRADQQKTRQILSDLGNLRVVDFLSEDPKDLHTYQLDEQPTEVSVWTGAADTGKTLLLGHPLTNDVTKVVAKRKGADSIFTISADDAKKFAVQINDLRDHRVLTFNETEVRGIELVRGADKLVLAREAKEEAGWKLTAPVTVAAEEATVRALLDQLANLTITQFVADVATDLDKYGLAAPAATVTLTADGTNVIAQLLVGSADGSNAWRHVKRADEPSVYGIATNILELLPSNALAVRTRKLATLTPDQITKLTVQQGANVVTVERDTEKKWKLVQPAQGVLDVDALQRLLDTLGQVRALEYLRAGLEDLPAYGLDAPILTVTAMVGDKSYKLAVGKPHNDWQKFASWSDPALIFTISTADLAPLTKGILTTVAKPAAEPLAPAK